MIAIYKLNKDLFSVAAGESLWLPIEHDDIEGYALIGVGSFEAGSPGLTVNAISNGMRVVNPKSYKIDVSENAAFIEYVYVKAGKASN